MTKEEILEMGMQAGISKPVLLLGNNLKLLTTFAKLVAEKERDKFPKVQVKPWEFNMMTQGKEDITGVPIAWSQWPTEERK